MDTTTAQAPALVWTAEGPRSRIYDDVYYSAKDGLAEARYVFLDGSDAAGVMAATPDPHICELGFGTGLNLLAAWALFREVGQGRLRFTSFEAHPMATEDMARAHVAFPELAGLSGELIAGPPFTDMELDLRIGMARDQLEAFDGMADIWFLDGFAPSRNPEMWTEEVMTLVAAHTKPGGRLATYTAAGHVRRALEAAGFEVTRRPGFAGKRHMTTAVKR